jgi:hypothetical protein
MITRQYTRKEVLNHLERMRQTQFRRISKSCLEIKEHNKKINDVNKRFNQVIKDIDLISL